MIKIDRSLFSAHFFAALLEINKEIYYGYRS